MTCRRGQAAAEGNTCSTKHGSLATQPRIFDMQACLQHQRSNCLLTTCSAANLRSYQEYRGLQMYFMGSSVPLQRSETLLVSRCTGQACGSFKLGLPSLLSSTM